MYKENYDFPAIIINHSSDDYEIRIYDFKEVTVYDDNLDDCYSAIQEALEGEIYKYICLNKEIPKATSIEEISFWRFGSTCGSKELWRSCGTSTSNSPYLLRTVLDFVPLR